MLWFIIMIILIIIMITKINIKINYLIVEQVTKSPSLIRLYACHISSVFSGTRDTLLIIYIFFLILLFFFSL